MREIKFRAWNGHNMVQPIYDLAMQYGSSRQRPFFLMQYTGLKDKNGVEIYEGDVVEVATERVSSSHSTWYQRTNQHHGDETLNMYVLWDAGALRWGLSLCTKEEHLSKMEPRGNERTLQHVHVPYDPTDRSCCARGKVIGNIYENPELLREAV